LEASESYSPISVFFEPPAFVEVLTENVKKSFPSETKNLGLALEKEFTGTPGVSLLIFI